MSRAGRHCVALAVPGSARDERIAIRRDVHNPSLESLHPHSQVGPFLFGEALRVRTVVGSTSEHRSRRTPLRSTGGPDRREGWPVVIRRTGHKPSLVTCSLLFMLGAFLFGEAWRVEIPRGFDQRAPLAQDARRAVPIAGRDGRSLKGDPDTIPLSEFPRCSSHRTVYLAKCVGLRCLAGLTTECPGDIRLDAARHRRSGGPEPHAAKDEWVASRRATHTSEHRSRRTPTPQVLAVPNAVRHGRSPQGDPDTIPLPE